MVGCGRSRKESRAGLRQSKRVRCRKMSTYDLRRQSVQDHGTILKSLSHRVMVPRVVFSPLCVQGTPDVIPSREE